MPTGLSVQEKKRKTDFKMAAMLAILDFGSEQFQLFFIYRSARCFLPSFKSIQVNWPFGSREEAENRFSSGHFGFPIGKILAILTNNSPQCFLLSYKSVGPTVQKKKRKIDFQDYRHSGRLRFPIGTISALFDLQVTPMFLTKFQVFFVFFWFRRRSKKNFFKTAAMARHLGFPIGTILAIFELQVTPMLPTKFQVIGLLVQEKKRKIDFQDSRAILDFRSEQF